MSKRKKNEFPSIEKMERMGFQDGYAGEKSNEDTILKEFCNRGINHEQIKIRVLAYSLGYKKGRLLHANSLDNFKVINGKVALNGKVIELDSNIQTIVEEKIKNHPVKSKKKGRRK